MGGGAILGRAAAGLRVPLSPGCGEALERGAGGRSRTVASSGTLASGRAQTNAPTKEVRPLLRSERLPSPDHLTFGAISFSCERV